MEDLGAVEVCRESKGIRDKLEIEKRTENSVMIWKVTKWVRIRS